MTDGQAKQAIKRQRRASNVRNDLTNTLILRKVQAKTLILRKVQAKPHGRAPHGVERGLVLQNAVEVGAAVGARAAARGAHVLESAEVVVGVEAAIVAKVGAIAATNTALITNKPGVGGRARAQKLRPIMVEPGEDSMTVPLRKAVPLRTTQADYGENRRPEQALVKSTGSV